MRSKVAGTHRRQRPVTRPGRAGIWVGLFILLAAGVTAASHDLWLEAVRGLMSPDRSPLPRAIIIWEAECPPEALISVNAFGEVLAAYQSETEEEGAPPRVVITRVTVRDRAVLASEAGVAIAAAYRNREATGLEELSESAGEPWRVAIARPAPDYGEAGRLDYSGPTEEGLWVGPAGPEGVSYLSRGGILTSAHPWGDGGVVLLGVYYPDLGEGPEGVLVAVDEQGREVWSRSIGREPIHRIASYPGSGFIGAAVPGAVALLDTRGNLLWTKRVLSKVTGLALQRHGGPVVVTGKKMLVYDRRGNLLWKKEVPGRIAALVCGGQRIAIGFGVSVTTYDEEGLARWSLECPSPVSGLGLSAEALVLAVVTESGRLLVARPPGGTSPLAPGGGPP